MLITICDQIINPDHIVRLHYDGHTWPCMIMSDGVSITSFHSETVEDLANKINDAIRREKQRDQGCHKEFTQFGLV